MIQFVLHTYMYIHICILPQQYLYIFSFCKKRVPDSHCYPELPLRFFTICNLTDFPSLPSSFYYGALHREGRRHTY